MLFKIRVEARMIYRLRLCGRLSWLIGVMKVFLQLIFMMIFSEKI